MSEPSSNTIVTWERPYLESDRIWVMPGSPASSVSMGKVTSFSISSGASAGTSVLTCTWTLVMSGTASTGRRMADQRPTPIRIRVANRTRVRCLSAAVTSQLIIA